LVAAGALPNLNFNCLLKLPLALSGLMKDF